MRIRAELIGSFGEVLADEVRAGERATTAAISAAGSRLRDNWRSQIMSAGLGARLARTIRLSRYPNGRPSLNAAALVWTKAPEIVGAHDAGVTIRSKDGFWLAIPTDAAGRGRGGRRITPGEWEARTGLRLRFVYRADRPSLLVAEGRLSSRGRAVQSRSKTGRGRMTIPIFTLVPQVTLRKRLNLEAPIRSAVDQLGSDIVQRWKDI